MNSETKGKGEEVTELQEVVIRKWLQSARACTACSSAVLDP